jgi:hypothetical protein
LLTALPDSNRCWASGAVSKVKRPASISGYVEPASGGETIDEDFDGLLAKVTGDLDSVAQ